MSASGLPAHCGEYLALALAHLDASYPEGEVDVSIVLAHVEACPPCHGEYYVQRQVKYLVQRTAGCTVTPDGLRTRIVTRIEQSSVTRIQRIPDAKEPQ